MIRQEIQFDKPLFLVANKVDLARHRVVTEKGTHPKKIIFYIAYFKISTILIYFLFLDEIIYYQVRFTCLNYCRNNTQVFCFIQSIDAKKVATRYNCKYIETSVALNHNVDQLLAGVIRQVRSRRQNNVYHPEAERIEDSKTPSMFTKILLQKLMKIGHHDLSCTRLFDV